MVNTNVKALYIVDRERLEFKRLGPKWLRDVYVLLCRIGEGGVSTECRASDDPRGKGGNENAKQSPRRTGSGVVGERKETSKVRLLRQ